MERFTWRRLIWQLVFPQRRHRISPTIPGLFLMVLALGIGTAAYNTANNILFITLSLLLACLLLSGLLSWFNFKGLRWRLVASGPWRVGHDTLVMLDVENTKRGLPTYSLAFDFLAQPSRMPTPPDDIKGVRLREILAAAEKHLIRGRVPLRGRLEPGGHVTLEWGVKPVRRGEATVELTSVGSLFPFGFLRKSLGATLRQRVVVWPAQIEYQWSAPVLARVGAGGRRTPRLGSGDDLQALRRYRVGDSHRLVHWKASARLGQMMVRQFAAEAHDGYAMRLDASATLWPRAEQFELACSLAATLAEDLFAGERLAAAVLRDGTVAEIRQVRDLELWLDELARLETVEQTAPRPVWVSRLPLITFAPEGARGVGAYVDGRQIASA